MNTDRPVIPPKPKREQPDSITIRVSPALKKDLARVAKDAGQTLSAVCIEFLQFALERYK